MIPQGNPSTAGQRYGLSLHYDKFQLLHVGSPSDSNVKMPDGRELDAKNEMTYLGTVLSADGRVSNELSRRIGLARGSFRTLCKIWNHTSLTRKRKLEVYRSLIESRLLYGLSCCCFTVSDLRRLDGFQAKCLRKVIGVAPSYYSGVSNKDVLHIAGHRKASSRLADQQVVLLG